MFRFTGNEAFVVPPRNYENVEVGGRERAKFFRKPLIPFMETIQPLVVLDTGRSTTGAFGDSAAKFGPGRLLGPPKPIIATGQPTTKSQAIQTDYMEREAQTDPYTPEYVVKPGEQPEVLTLATLMYSTSSIRTLFYQLIYIEFYRKRSSSWSCRSRND
jgi:hypothetical protein